MSNKEKCFDEIMKNADMASGLDLGDLWGNDEYEDEYEDDERKFDDDCDESSDEDESEETPERGRGPEYSKCSHKRKVKPMKINCDLEVGVGNKNKVIYVCPGRLQYFTANAISCCGDETIEIKYTGHKGTTKTIGNGEVVIKGCLGFYKIVKSGIIFIPNNFLSEFADNGCHYPTDILPFKAKDRCSKDVEFVVVFTYSRCVNCCPTGCGK